MDTRTTRKKWREKFTPATQKGIDRLLAGRRETDLEEIWDWLMTKVKPSDLEDLFCPSHDTEAGRVCHARYDLLLQDLVAPADEEEAIGDTPGTPKIDVATIHIEVRVTIKAMYYEYGLDHIAPELENYLFSWPKPTYDVLVHKLAMILGCKPLTTDQCRYRLAQVLKAWRMALTSWVDNHQRELLELGRQPNVIKTRINDFFTCPQRLRRITN